MWQTGSSQATGTLALLALGAIGLLARRRNNGQQFPYLAISFSTDGSGDPSTIDNIVFEPPYPTPSTGNPSLPDQGATVLYKWQTWDALEGGWWDGNVLNAGSGVQSFASLLAEYPLATIMDFPAPYAEFLGLEFEVGQGEPGDPFDGNVDNVTIGLDNVNTTYDFEPSSITSTPEPSSLLVWCGLGAIGLLFSRRKFARSVIHC